MNNNNNTAAKTEEEKGARLSEYKVLMKVFQKAFGDTFFIGYAGFETATVVDNFFSGNPYVNMPLSYTDVIYSHGFAKAFFGVFNMCSCGEILNKGMEPCRKGVILEAWEYHLQQMVLEENPIDYLRKFVEGGEK